MFIAIVDFTTRPEDRANATTCLAQEAVTVRAMPGNIGFRAFADPEDAGAICILHEWQSAEDFAAYARSDTFARSGQVLRPMMTGAPVSRRFVAELLEQA